MLHLKHTRDRSLGKPYPFYAVRLRHLVALKAQFAACCRSGKRVGDPDPVVLGRLPV